jgi:hypothetical protein
MLDKSREPDVAISLLADDSMADHGMVLSEVPRMPQPPTITSPSEGSQHAAFFDVLIEGTCDENATSVDGLLIEDGGHFKEIYLQVCGLVGWEVGLARCRSRPGRLSMGCVHKQAIKSHLKWAIKSSRPSRQ